MKDFLEYIDQGTYVCATFDAPTNTALKVFAQSLGLDPIENLHATIVYSKKPLRGVIENGDFPIEPLDEGKIMGIGYLGEEGSKWRAIVLHIQSNTLQQLFNKYVEDHGYVCAFDEYKQHVSLAYKPPEDLDLSEIELPRFPIVFETLEVKPLSQDH